MEAAPTSSELKYRAVALVVVYVSTRNLFLNINDRAGNSLPLVYRDSARRGNAVENDIDSTTS